MKPGGWEKAPVALVKAFAAALEELPGAETRKMFGYPAAFANEYLFTGLFEDRWFVRLPDDALAELAAAGGTTFEPMPGRPMRGYLAMPDELVADPVRRRRWLERGLAFVIGLPPKEKKPRRAR
jgi:TfoX/Sxy family transcriptional regulator of competence genes